MAFSNRGLVHFQRGELEEAIADFSEAIRLDPEEALPFYNRGRARSDGGDVEGAIADFEEGARLDPEDEDFQLRLDELRG